jgi:hypothetical protein
MPDNDNIWNYVDDDEPDDDYYDQYYDQYDADWDPQSQPIEYFAGFPNDWRETQVPGTGPEECLNCADYGCIERMFMGYCVNCAIYVYNGTRGRGFIDVGLESDETDYPSAYDLYICQPIHPEEQEETQEQE